MKNSERYLSKYLAILAVFLLFGNKVIANSKLGFDSQKNNKVIPSFQEDKQEKPFLFNEISIGEASQTISQNENFGFGLLGMFYSRQEYSHIKVFSALNSSYLLKDKRELIFQYLFPFHFFW